MRIRASMLVLSAGVAAGRPCAGQPVAYVNAGAAAGGNGQSWATAFRDLQDALALPAPREIWVATGTYTPDRGTGNRSMRFLIPSGVALFGGFVGIETQRDQRNPAMHPTTLSGDLLRNDGPQFANYADNSWTVVAAGAMEGFVIRGASASAVMIIGDAEVVGCTLTANQSAGPGGAFTYAPSASATATIEECRFINNRATGSDGRGGAVYMSGGGPGLSISGTLFQENTAESAGGAIWGGPVINDCVFESNMVTAPTGTGGAIGGASGRITGCTFTGNSAASGGAVHAGPGSGELLLNCVLSANRADDGGAVFLRESESVVRECIFTGNSAVRGGAILFDRGSAVLLGCTLVDNHGFYGGAVNLAGGRPTVLNTVFLGNSTVIPNASGGSGGAMYLQGTMALIANSVFSGNHAESFAGAIAGEFLQGASIVSCTFSRNRADQSGGGLFVVGAVGPALANCILWQNTDPAGSGAASQLAGGAPYGLRYSTVSAWAGTPAGPGNSAADPLLLDPLGPDLMAGTPDDDVRLARFSPAVDSADNAALPTDTFDLNNNGNFNEPVPFDAAGGPRFLDDPRWPNGGAGAGVPSDRGAFEFHPPACYPNCDGSVGTPTLNVNDFLCFQARFAQGDPYANCDGSTALPMLTVNDFVCFLNAFAGGCP